MKDLLKSFSTQPADKYDGVSRSFRTESITEYTHTRTVKGYGGKTHYADSQNSDTTAPSGRELYHLQFLLQTASPETFGYTLVLWDLVLLKNVLDFFRL
jgi:hypothetical protein